MTITYVMEAKENYPAAQVANMASDSPWDVLQTTQALVGLSYDAQRRKIMYLGTFAAQTLTTNDTGFTLWSGVSTIDIDGSYSTAASNFNKDVHVIEKDVDTGAVVSYPVWTEDSVVPNGIGGSDGTYRRFVQDLAFGADLPLLVNPHNNDVWFSSESCELYQLRFLDDFTQHISPVFPVDDPLNLVKALGITTSWAYAVELHFVSGTPDPFYLIPSTFTAAEIAADYKLIYATYAGLPSTEDRFYMTTVDKHGNLWVFSAATSGARDYALQKFTPPSAFVYPTPPVDGGFTTVTPWGGATGPNTDVGAYTACNQYDQDPVNNSTNAVFYLPATDQLVLISKLFCADAGSTDPADTRFDLTYVTISGLAFDYHAAFVSGFMTASWETAADADHADYAVVDFRVHNQYRQMSDFTYDEDYTKQVLAFSCYQVAEGVIGTDLFTVLVYYTFNGTTVTVDRVVPETGWDSTYTAYATAISADFVVQNSFMPDETDANLNTPYIDTGLWLRTEDVFWWSGQNANLYQLDAAFTPRASLSSHQQPPFLRLSFGEIYPIPTGRAAMVRSYIGPAKARTPSVIGPPLHVPENTSVPTLSGAAIVGQSLSVSVGSWTGNPNSFAIQVLRNGAPIAGATSSPYLVVEDDAGQDISAQVIASNGAGASDPAESAAVVPTDAAPLAPEFTSPPFITGTGVVGSVLTGHVGIIANNPTSVAYQWNLSGSSISGETGLTYVPVTGDIGTDTITFTVSASNTTPPTAVATSDPITVVAAGGSDIPLADKAALDAMLAAGVGASGGKSYILAAGDYGGASYSNLDYSTDPIVIKGQPVDPETVTFAYITMFNSKGITWGPDINCYDRNPSFGYAIAAYSGSDHIIFDNVRTLTDIPDGGPYTKGNGFQVRNSSFTSIIGTVGKLTSQGRGAGGGIVDSTHTTIQGWSNRNFEADGILIAGTESTTINQYLGYDAFPQPGDHPDFLQWFTAGSTLGHNNDLTVTNSLGFQGIGSQSQGFFGEGTGTNHTFDTCGTFGGMVGSFEQSSGIGVTWNNCFSQGYGGISGGNIIARGGAVNATMTNNTVQSAGTYPPEEPYPGFTSSGNTLIGAAASATDYTQLDPWLAANPLVPGRPY